jgi:proteic killer suppression protein
MIISFAHKGLEEFFAHGSKRHIRPEHAARLARILDRLDAAHHVEDMRYPGSNLHPLEGDRAGEWAVNVSGNWRVTFRFQDGQASHVGYEDYH